MTRLLERPGVIVSDEMRDLAQRLTDAGYKVTSPRLAVLQAALSHDGSFTAAEVERWLSDRAESPGEASIFRTLKLLTDIGVAERIHGVDDCHRYTLGSGHRHRVVCTSCGRLHAFEDCAIGDLIGQLQRATGFTIDSHLLELFGRCPDCQASQPAGVRDDEGQDTST